MKRASLKFKSSNCEILRDSIKYLGRMVDRHGMRPDPEAVEAVSQAMERRITSCLRDHKAGTVRSASARHG